MSSLLIYGSGGHGKVVADCAKCLGLVIAGFFDRENSYAADYKKEIPLLIAIGNPNVRREIARTCRHQFTHLIHPSAVVAEDVQIGEGTVILAGAVIQTGAVIGRHVIINANVTIDHDAVIDDFVTTYPGVYIGGEASIGRGAILNANVVVERSARIEDFTVL